MGKTSLVRQFQEESCVQTQYIPHYNTYVKSAFDSFKDIGIDLKNQFSSIRHESDLVVILDDAQRLFHEKSFWESLLMFSKGLVPLQGAISLSIETIAV
jgi:hypothetical protein